ncbi:MAG: tRNA 2-thiocytidine(32) synthetase TtcA [Polyangiaceae bacterium]|nr:tRNA 2-thiocytidine(32) synthetase TtcA [Polyangiaceae bacterium]
MRKTCEKHELLKDGDNIMVAVSGGKDSYGLLVLLTDLVKRLPFKVSLIAVHLDQAQPGYDGRSLESWLQDFGVPYEILREDTYSVVLEHTKEGGTYCSMCSRLRRGILYQAAERLGCNKIALGHHRDDALETFMMNLFYSGKLQSMPAGYKTDDGKFDVIRPLIQCEEERLASFAQELDFPILPCNLCGSQDGLKRDRMTRLLADLESENPHLKSVMMAALGNVCPTHLLDRDVERAWAERDESIPAKASLGQGKSYGDKSAELLRPAGGAGVGERKNSEAVLKEVPSVANSHGPRRLPLLS